MSERWRPKRIATERGFSLAELLVVIAIMGLFIAVAIPAIGNYIRAARVRASNDTLVGDLRAARYIAITTRGADIDGDGTMGTTVFFNTAARTWSYTDIHNKTITRTLEQGTTFTTLTNVPVNFKSDGSISTNPATIGIQGTVTTGVLHTFTISISSVGRVSSVFTRT